MQDYAPGSAAAGTLTPNPSEPIPAPQSAGYMTADDTPNLLDQTNRPQEPLTAGLPMGPGPGPTTMKDQSAITTATLKQYLPALEASANMPNMPPEWIQLVQYIRNAPDTANA